LPRTKKYYLSIPLQAPHLQAAQSKIKEIYKAVKVVHPQAEARVVRFFALF